MKFNRTLRLGEAIQREIARILLQEINESQSKNITIAAVRVAPDLSTAKVFVGTFNDKTRDEAIAFLQEKAAEIRNLLAHNLNLRRTPKLNFVYDNSIIHGEKLQSLIDKAIARDEALGKDKVSIQRQLVTGVKRQL